MSSGQAPDFCFVSLPENEVNMFLKVYTSHLLLVNVNVAYRISQAVDLLLVPRTMTLAYLFSHKKVTTFSFIAIQFAISNFVNNESLKSAHKYAFYGEMTFLAIMGRRLYSFRYQ